MNWSQWLRKIHRWLSIVFTAAVIVNGVAVARGHYTAALGLLAVAPLAVLLVSGLYLFVLPHAARWRGGRRTGG